MKLHIEMFGEFTIYVDGEKNFQYEGRTRKLWNLLQYLLVNRNRPVPQAELFSIAHLDGKKGKPENSYLSTERPFGRKRSSERRLYPLPPWGISVESGNFGDTGY